MKTQRFGKAISFFVLLSFMLASCTSAATVAPTDTATPSITPLPINTFMLTTTPAPNWIRDFALSPDGSEIAIYTNSGIYLYDTQTLNKTTFKKFDDPDYVSEWHGGGVAFSIDGTKIATSSKHANNFVGIWDADAGELQKGIYAIPNGYYVDEIEFSPTGNTIFVRSVYPHANRCELAEDSLALYTYDDDSGFPSESKLFERNFCRYVPGTFKFISDGTFYLILHSLGDEYWVYIGDSSTGQVIKKNEYKVSTNGRIYDVSQNGRVYAISKNDSEPDTKLVDSESKQILLSIPGRVKLLKDENQFLVEDSTMQTSLKWGNATFLYSPWNLWKDGGIQCSFDGIALFPQAKFSADNNYFAVPTVDDKIQIWKVSTCEKINTISLSE